MQPVGYQSVEPTVGSNNSNGNSNAGKKTYIFALACACCFLPLLITSFAMCLVARTRVLNMQGYFDGFISNWQSDMIYGFTTDPNIQVAQGQYIQPWVGNWPGTIQGCWCADSNWYRGTSQGLKTRSCNSNETRYGGCVNVNSKGSVPLKTWMGGQNLYVVKFNGTSFMQNYDKIDSKGTCKQGFVNCGNLSSISKGICLPSNIPTCPITRVSNTQFANSQLNSFPSFTFYVSRENGSNPICEATITEQYLCTARSLYSVTTGRTRYSLLNGYFQNCQKDFSAIPVSEVGERDLFDWNGVPYQSLPTYDVSNNYRYELMVVPFLEWSPSCAGEVGNVVNMSQTAGSLVDSYFLLFVLYIISFIGCIIVLFFMCFFADQSSNKLAIIGCLFLMRVAFFILVLPSMIIVYNKASKLGNTFENVTTKNCSTDSANSNFGIMYSKYNSDIWWYCKWWFWLAIVEFIIECIVFLYLIYGNIAEENTAGSEYTPENPFGSNDYKYQELQNPNYSPQNQNSPYKDNNKGNNYVNNQQYQNNPYQQRPYQDGMYNQNNQTRPPF